MSLSYEESYRQKEEIGGLIEDFLQSIMSSDLIAYNDSLDLN